MSAFKLSLSASHDENFKVVSNIETIKSLSEAETIQLELKNRQAPPSIKLISLIYGYCEKNRNLSKLSIVSSHALDEEHINTLLYTLKTLHKLADFSLRSPSFELTHFVKLAGVLAVKPTLNSVKLDFRLSGAPLAANANPLIGPIDSDQNPLEFSLTCRHLSLEYAKALSAYLTFMAHPIAITLSGHQTELSHAEQNPLIQLLQINPNVSIKLKDDVKRTSEIETQLNKLTIENQDIQKGNAHVVLLARRFENQLKKEDAPGLWLPFSDHLQSQPSYLPSSRQYDDDFEKKPEPKANPVVVPAAQKSAPTLTRDTQ